MSIGFLTIAQNTPDVDYLRMAYVQAMSIKLTMPTMSYAVIVDEETAKEVDKLPNKVFDHVITLPHDRAKDDDWKLANEPQVFALTPFKETIKVESDILFTRSIEHWIHLFRKRDVVMSTGCKNFMQVPATSRKYRTLFDDNDLPDVYTGLMYFRFSRTAEQFFKTAGDIFFHWDTVHKQLLRCSDIKPTTDVVYALASKIIGVEHTTIPTADHINFVHMKTAINNWYNNDWQDQVNTELDLPMIRINNVNQYHPLHYQSKEWLTDDIVKTYEQYLNSSD